MVMMRVRKQDTGYLPTCIQNELNDTLRIVAGINNNGIGRRYMGDNIGILLPLFASNKTYNLAATMYIFQRGRLVNQHTNPI